MAGRIRDEDIALVRERSSIEDVIGERVALRPAGGGNLKGLCPFHDEKSPSFNVTPARGLFHCLAGETRVLTGEGPREIRDLAGGTHRILNRRGVWVDAPFRSYGVQPLLRITVGRNGQRKELYATDEHRWFAKTGGGGRHREVLTKDLKPGHRLAAMFPRSRIRLSTPSRFGIAHGFTFGDGHFNGSGGIRRAWTVHAVETTDRVEEVFCAEVEDGHAFVLEDNILTGNCFGCGVGGDAIAFVQRVDGLSFAEAVQRLADRAGVQLRYEQGGAAPARPQGQRTRLVEASRLAADFYATALRSPEAQVARDFLTGRGFDAAAAATYGCGYAPAAWDALTRHLLDRGFSQAELVTAGLSRQSSRGSLIDRFHRRLLWPIRDVSGDVVGFGARRLHDDDPIEAKYLNTPETPIYHKGQVLYGADLAKKEIARRRQAVVVEGYTDVMACHLAGVPTAVATCGTAFGADHIAVLRRLMLDHGTSGEIIFVFDGDEAGQRAARRAFEEDQRFLMQTFVAVEESGLDPCDLRLSKGDMALRDLVARRKPAIELAIRAAISDFNLDSIEGRLRALDAAAPIVANIKDVAARSRYSVELDRYLGFMDEPFIIQRVDELVGRGQPRRRLVAPPSPNDPAVAVEREVLKLAVQEPQLAGPVFDAIDESAFTEPGYAVIRRAIADAGGAAQAQAGPKWVERISEYCPDLVTKSTLTELAVERLRKQAGQQLEWYVATQLFALQEREMSRQIKLLLSKLQRINPLEEPDTHARLFGELVALEQYARGLREQAMGS